MIGVTCLVVVALGVVNSVRRVRDRGEARQRSAIGAHLDAIDAAESSGDFDRALAEAETVLELAATTGIAPPADLAACRENLARRAATLRLDAVGPMPPAQSVPLLARLREQAVEDPALSALKGRIADALTDAARRLAESQLETASHLLESGRAGESLDALRRVRESVVRYVPTGATALRLHAEIDGLVSRIAAGHGLIVELSRGSRYYLGSPLDYERGLVAMAADALQRRGYVPTPPEASWAAIWLEEAPNRLTVEVHEEPTPYATSSALNATRVDGSLTLRRGRRTLWQGHASVRTRMPPPGLPAYLATRYATATRRDLAAERQLQQDALNALAERIAPQLGGLPPSAVEPRSPSS